MSSRFVPVVAVCLIAVSLSVVAEHEVLEGDYFTAVFLGDNFVICSLEVEGVEVPIEDEFGWCLGGYSFSGLDRGRWEISVEDNHVDFVSGAYRVEDGSGNVAEDNVDECFDVPLATTEVPQGGLVAVWIDGVLWWATGQPCGDGQTSQGTFGTITIEHLKED